MEVGKYTAGRLDDEKDKWPKTEERRLDDGMAGRMRIRVAGKQ